jgi:hypothetical protein
MPKTEIEGYHFTQTEDGAFAIEVDNPCEGIVTLTWKPQEYPGKPTTIELPAALFLPSVQSYLRERTDKAKP